MGPLTLHQLHDDVDGLLLGADADEPDYVGVVVLFEDPVGTVNSTVSTRGPSCPHQLHHRLHPKDAVPGWCRDTAPSQRDAESQWGLGSPETSGQTDGPGQA